MASRSRLVHILLLLLAAAAVAIATAPTDLGTLSLYGEAPIDLSAVAAELLAELSPTVTAANRTLLVTETSSLHMFATNRTESCHYHPGETLQRLLYGGGQFYVDYSAPVPQAVGDSFVIPPRRAHAFDGALHGPSIVLVRWTPPYSPPYIIPTTGCQGLPGRD